MVMIGTKDIWTVAATTLGPRPWYHKKGEPVDMIVIGEDDQFVMETENGRPTHVLKQRAVGPTF